MSFKLEEDWRKTSKTKLKTSLKQKKNKSMLKFLTLDQLFFKIFFSTNTKKHDLQSLTPESSCQKKSVVTVSLAVVIFRSNFFLPKNFSQERSTDEKILGRHFRLEHELILVSQNRNVRCLISLVPFFPAARLLATAQLRLAMAMPLTHRQVNVTLVNLTRRA